MPDPKPTTLTTEQQRRVEVLPHARKALESTTAAGMLATPSRQGPSVTDLLKVADWLLHGSGQYDEATGDDEAELYLHAKELDDTRLCGSSGLGTTFWRGVTCPACQAEMAKRTGTIDPGAERRANEEAPVAPSLPEQRGGDEAPPALEPMHYGRALGLGVVGSAACGKGYSYASAIVTGQKNAVTCEACILKLAEREG